MSKYIDADLCEQYFYEHMDDKAMEIAMIAINDMPAADVAEVRHGRWIYRQLPMPLSDGSKECVECSVCHTHWDGEMNYCPNCGAKMDGDTE